MSMLFNRARSRSRSNSGSIRSSNGSILNGSYPPIDSPENNRSITSLLNEPLIRGKTNSTDSTASSEAAASAASSGFAAALMKAEMKQIEYMTSEISISHKRNVFRNLIEDMEKNHPSPTADEEDVPTGRVSPTTANTLAKTKRLLAQDIPKILADLRKSVVENELLIQELRYSLGYGESEGVWGRQSNSIAQKDSSLINDIRESTNISVSEGRRSTWHGDRDSSSVREGKMDSLSNWGRPTNDTDHLSSTDATDKEAADKLDISEFKQTTARRLSLIDMASLTERVRSHTVAAAGR